MEKGAAFILLQRREVPACGRRFEDAAEGGVPYATAPLIMVLAVLRRPCLACGFSHSQGLKATSRPWLARSCSRSQGSTDKRNPGWDISFHPARVEKRKRSPGWRATFSAARVLQTKEALARIFRFNQPGSENGKAALAGTQLFPQPGSGGQKEPWLRYFVSSSQGRETENRPWPLHVISPGQGCTRFLLSICAANSAFCSTPLDLFEPNNIFHQNRCSPQFLRPLSQQSRPSFFSPLRRVATIKSNP